ARETGLSLGARRSSRTRDLQGTSRRPAFAAIVARQRDLFLARGAGGFRILGDLTRQRAAKSGEMGTAVALRNVVGKAEDAFVVAVIPPESAFDCNAVTLDLDHDGGRDKGSLVPIEKLYEGFDAALVFHFFALFDGMPLVGKDDRDSGVEERQFAQTVLERREIELDHGEGFGRGEERDLGAALVLRFAFRLQRSLRDPVAELHEVSLAVTPYCQLQPCRKRIDHRHADAVQP